VEVVQLVITSLLAAIGLYLAHSYRRQQRLSIAERRLDAYAKLWALTEVARPTRVKDVSVDRQGPLSRQEARELYQEMTHWYFGSGNGLLFTEAAKELYLKVKANLGAYAEGGGSPSDEEGTRRMQELGLLRAQMRLDLEIYSTPYLQIPDHESRRLLEAAGIDADGWGTPPWRTRIADRMRQRIRRVTAKLPPARH
jgi:hypothetical protein